MKTIKLLTVIACALALTSLSTLAAAKCCDDAKKAGKECEHKCCVEAAKAKKVCEKCDDGKKEEAKKEDAKKPAAPEAKK